jgi:hypothetical protein
VVKLQDRSSRDGSNSSNPKNILYPLTFLDKWRPLLAGLRAIQSSSNSSCRCTFTSQISYVRQYMDLSRAQLSGKEVKMYTACAPPHTKVWPSACTQRKGLTLVGMGGIGIPPIPSLIGHSLLNCRASPTHTFAAPHCQRQSPLTTAMCLHSALPFSTLGHLHPWPTPKQGTPDRND